MKRSCKNIDLTDWQQILPHVTDCIERHYTRWDFRRLICGIGGMGAKDYQIAAENHNKAALAPAEENIAKEAARRIRAYKLQLDPVAIGEKVDNSSFKHRLIGRESAMQQVLDHIAVGASEEIWKRRLVPNQASSIAGRGPVSGTKKIQKWIMNDNKTAAWSKAHGKRYYRKCRYAAKLDIENCYGSADAQVFMSLFRRDCGNERLIWLWDELLKSHRVNGYTGFMIGALPSQWAMQYLISYVYRFAMDLHIIRRGRRIKSISHMLIYMDDMLVFGSSRKNLKSAIRKIVKYVRDKLHMKIKGNWQIFEVDDTPVDMMGYVVHADGAVTIRARIFLRFRRVALRCLRRKKMTIGQARRICSYKGYIRPSPKRKTKLNLRNRKITKELQLKKLFNAAANMVSRADRRANYDRRIQCAAG